MSVSSPPGPDGPVLSTSRPFGLEIRSHTSLTSEGLSKVQSAGLKGAEDVFAHHNGGIPSGKALAPLVPRWHYGKQKKHVKTG
ncbi:hypothetical protein B0H14DRAFT_3424793 [Mycena olivaceomarginata]|nr:hypothetical protein B0H14DRAFT_3424793 [Mycena olivaceomarginata]